MGDHLRVDPERLREASRFVAGKAQLLRERLDKLDGTIGKRLLEEGWTGKAATGYDGSWTDWKKGADAMIAALDESATKLADAANTYVAQDDANRDTFTGLNLPDPLTGRA
ncbi:WXG100 family type VII secretion target [Nocardia sp. NPDC088792]|uniref:WXG100 family type VII secretion target n=1 Tax=Nocardia sp. NPDC088792 TaxID=3364332 RepID=UPI003803F956